MVGDFIVAFVPVSTGVWRVAASTTVAVIGVLDFLNRPIKYCVHSEEHPTP